MTAPIPLRVRSFRLSVPLVATIFLALHVPFLPASPEDVDSINFALGVARFDVEHHRPHPPGYPLYIALGKLAHGLISPEWKALAALSVVAGALGILALAAFFRRVDPEATDTTYATTGTLLTITAPLYWFTSARPLSDVPALAAAIAVQALTLAASSDTAVAIASFFAALTIGIRSQALWLTVPLLVLAIVGRPPGRRVRTALGALVTFIIGVALWALPLVVMTGGPWVYLQALSKQGQGDFAGVEMLWTHPTRHQLVQVFEYAFIAPWAFAPLGTAVIACAVIGVVRMMRSARPGLLTLTVAFGPYLAFDALFQEPATARYALPLVPPVAYLAVRGVTTRSRLSTAVPVLLAGCAMTIGVPALVGYARLEAPAFHMLSDMRAWQAPPTATATLPLIAMHRREDLDLKRPLDWLGQNRPRWSARVAAPPKREWLQIVHYWADGGRDPIWFVADPLRSDLALIDPLSRRLIASYRWSFGFHVLVGGVRPDVMDWYTIEKPGWFLGEGWALTPETAGAAGEAGHGPLNGAIRGWIHRRASPVTLLIGGRNLLPSGSAVRLTIRVDDRLLDTITVPAGPFLRMTVLPSGALVGTGDYATITIAADERTAEPDGVGERRRGVADAQRVAIEQFDAQSADRVVFGFGEGWHEREYDPKSGRLWRWTSKRAELRVRPAGHALTLRLAGQAPRTYFRSRPHVIVRIGDHVVANEAVASSFSRHFLIPAVLMPDTENVISIETDRVFVPAERGLFSRDRRQLGLRILQCELVPVL